MTDLVYRVVIRPLPADEGGGYVATVPDLRGCMGDGDTPQDALIDCLKAIEEWKDEALRMGREIPVPGSHAAAARREAKMIVDHLTRQEKVIEKQEDLIESQKKLLAASEEAVALVKSLTVRRAPLTLDHLHHFVIDWDSDDEPHTGIPLLMTAGARRGRELEN